ncbi:unnamed protein product [Ilex paraguariensis]|uniref:protein-serine/threonine phosphatase n=1 Tax=Ilex paraguariensis TaxID=185542 RepID=A0ABC8V033_9AQUA
MNDNIPDPLTSFSLSSENQTGSKMDSAVSCSLKRKRPPKIEIPKVLRDIGIDTKVTSIDCASQEEAFCFSGFGVGVSTVKGKKKFMEDNHKIVSFPNGSKGFFGVYDGHGGSKAAAYVAENLHTNIFEILKNCSGNTEKEEAVKQGT